MLKEFITYLEKEVSNHSIYVIGGQGQRGAAVTEPWIRAREKEARNADRAVAFWEMQCKAGYGSILGAFDCSGLGMYWLQNTKQLYKSDMTAHGMCSKCTNIQKEQLKKGDWVFITNATGRIVHIGYIVDDELNVIESRGRDWGVCKGPLTTRWNRYGRPEIFRDEIEGGTAQSATTNARTMRKNDSGDDVCTLQKTLIAHGYPLAKYGADGSFGAETHSAVLAFQKAAGLTADGIVGIKTATALGLTTTTDYKALYEQAVAQLALLKQENEQLRATM